MSLEYMQSFVKIGGVVFEKTRREKRTDYRIYYQDSNSEPLKWPKMTFFDCLNFPKFDFANI